MTVLARSIRIASTAGVALSLLAAGAISALPASASPSPTADPAFTINGTSVDEVSLDGTVLSLDAYQSIAASADLVGGSLTLVVDPSAVERGYLMAFSDDEEASDYMTAHGMGTLPSSDREPALEAATAAAKQASLLRSQLRTVAAASVCSLPNHMGYFYDNAACGGAAFGIGWNEAVPNLSTYGWNDRANSAALGDCIANLTIWINSNYGGSKTSLHGGDVYTALPIGYVNEVSSYKTDVTGPCA